MVLVDTSTHRADQIVSDPHMFNYYSVRSATLKVFLEYIGSPYDSSTHRPDQRSSLHDLDLSARVDIWSVWSVWFGACWNVHTSGRSDRIRSPLHDLKSSREGRFMIGMICMIWMMWRILKGPHIGKSRAYQIPTSWSRSFRKGRSMICMICMIFVIGRIRKIHTSDRSGRIRSPLRDPYLSGKVYLWFVWSVWCVWYGAFRNLHSSDRSDHIISPLHDLHLPGRVDLWSVWYIWSGARWKCHISNISYQIRSHHITSHQILTSWYRCFGAHTLTPDLHAFLAHVAGRKQYSLHGLCGTWLLG